MGVLPCDERVGQSIAFGRLGCWIVHVQASQQVSDLTTCEPMVGLAENGCHTCEDAELPRFFMFHMTILSYGFSGSRIVVGLVVVRWCR